MKKKIMEGLREKLLAQRSMILKQYLNNSNAMPTAVVELATGDAADAASSNEVKEMALNGKESDKKALKIVEDALSKMEAGTYGLCDECGKPIPEKRLLALPYARFCVICQERLEMERP